MSTVTPKAGEIERSWHILDAEGLIVGRFATEVATILRGKHKPTYTPNLDTGDHVIIINAGKAVLTSNKAERKILYRHTGYPGGIKSQTYAESMEKDAAETIFRSIRGMVPKTRLGNQQLSKLKVYAGAEHPHIAQNPQPLVIEHARLKGSDV